MPTKNLSPKISRHKPRKSAISAPNPQSSIFVAPQPCTVKVLEEELQSFPDPWSEVDPFSERTDTFWSPEFDGLDQGRPDLPNETASEAVTMVPGSKKRQPPVFAGEVLSILNKDGLQKHDTLWFRQVLSNVA
jgi:hypothetical protein